jgi:hypothetical protein
MKRSDRRFYYETPQHLTDAALSICVELDREYPYLAEFHLENDGTYRLFSLHTVSRSIANTGKEYVGKTGWDVAWIERDGTYAYHQSSGGGGLRHKVSGIYWRHPDMPHMVREETATYCDKAFRKRNKTRRLRRIPDDLLRDHYGRGKYDCLMEMLESTAIDSDVYYCAICEQDLPDRPESLCQHVWWCDETGALRGPGSDEYTEPCEDEDCYDCSRAKERAA